MTRSILILTIVAITVFPSCHKDNSPSGPSQAVPRFVVDNIGTSVEVKFDTTMQRLRSLVTLALVYHYDNYAGLLNETDISLEDSYAVHEFLDFGRPDSANKVLRFTETVPFPDSLSGKDTVKIVRQLGGVFVAWKSATQYEFVGTFLWQDSLYVRIKR